MSGNNPNFPWPMMNLLVDNDQFDAVAHIATVAVELERIRDAIGKSYRGAAEARAYLETLDL